MTDKDYQILSLLRVVSPDEHTRYAVNERYPMEGIRSYAPMSADRLLHIVSLSQQQQAKGNLQKEQIKKFLGTKLEMPPSMIEHCLLRAGQPANAKMATLFDGTEVKVEAIQRLADALQAGDEMLQQAMRNDPPLRGFIILKEVGAQGPTGSNQVIEQKDGPMLAFDEFHPFLYAQFENGPYKEFDTYNKAVDGFFSSIESQKADIKARQQEEQATRRLEQVKKEQESRIDGLIAAQISNERKAQLIELNLERVDQAILVIRSAVASAMDWMDLEHLVEEEKERQNPVALLIEGVKLQENQIVLRLSEPNYHDEFGFSDDSEDEEDEKPEHLGTHLIEVDIGLSAYANARRYYDMKKASAVKQEKTQKAVNKALKSAEKQVREELSKSKVNTAVLTKIRKPFWFERFLWFISTENYLVIGGRDAQQNELLVKRHLRKGDVYIHADLAGSSSVIVKNPSGKTISPITLAQAGTMAICNSRAWDAKIVTSAWWVYHDQVSKTAPTGEYLTTGSFMIRGKKNYLPPSQLVYGFGLLFRVADECIGRHLHERRPHLYEEDDNKTPEDAGSAGSASQESLEKAQGDKDEDEGPAADADDQEEDDLDTVEAIEAKLKAMMAQCDSSSDEDEPEAAAVSSSKYDLDEYGEEAPALVATQLGNDDEDNGLPRRKYVSKKDRRKTKKGETEQEQAPAKAPAPPPKAPAPTPAAAQKPVRGKRGKMKKMKEKYGDQDEEERTLRMTLLASSGGKHTEAPSKKEEEEIVESQPEPAADNSASHDSVDVPAQQEESQQQQQQPLPPPPEDEEDQAEIQRMLEEEKVAMVDENEVEDLSYLDSLTGNPVEDDILLACIPVCAPYEALRRYKYVVKLVPGSLKKGKAVKAVVHAFTSDTKMTPIERELLRNVPEPDMLITMLGKVKIMAAGMLQQKQKKQKKK